MPNTRRRSSSSRKSEDEIKDEKTLNPKSLLKNIVQLNETVAPSQPDDSPTVTNIKQTSGRRSSRRSSGMRALNKTPHALLKNFIENAQEETPAQLSSADDASIHSDSYLAPIPRKISKLAVDDQNVSSEGDVETDVVRKMPRIRHKAVLQKFSQNLKKQSESPGEDSGSEIKQLPSRAKKIRNKITAEDIASGIKLSQEKAAEIEKSRNVAEATKTELSLGYLSVNTLNAENLQDTIQVVAETQEKEDTLGKSEVKEDTLGKSEVKEDTLGKSEVKEDPLGKSEVKEDPLGKSEVKEDPLGKSEVKEDPLGKSEVKEDTLGKSEVKEDTLGKSEVKEDTLGKSEVKEDSFGKSEEKEDSFAKSEEKEDSASSKSENSSKRKRSMQRLSNVESLFDLSDEEEETMQKAKMLRLRADTAEFENVKPAEVEKTDVTNFVSEAELPEVAHTVEVGGAVEVTENVDGGSLEESRSHEVESKEIIQSLGKDMGQTPEEIATGAEDSIQLKLNEINKLLQESTVNTPDIKESTQKAVANTRDTKRTESPSVADGEPSRQIDLNKTSKEINMETVNVSRDSKKITSYPEDLEAVSDSPRGDDSYVSKGSSSKEYLAEIIGSSYVEATSKISELKRFTVEKYEMPHLASKMEESPTSGDPQTSGIDEATTGVFGSNFGSVSVKGTGLSIVSHESSPIASELSEVPVQSNETKFEEGEQSKETMLPEDKNEEPRRYELRSLRVSTDEQDELFPSSPKETTSSGHSRSSTPASSEADKATKRLTLPSSKSAFVEMKSSRSNVLSPSTSGISKRRISSVKKSSKKDKSSYHVIDSVASPTESALGIEVSHLTRDAQILPKSPFGTMRSLQYAAERPVAPEPQAGPSQIAANVSKAPRRNKINAHLKKYSVPPKVTNLLINHYSGLKIPSACLPDLGKISDRFLDNLFDALGSYARHANRAKVEAIDVELYFKRVGLIDNDKGLNTLIREYLPLEDQQLLIPVARAGNIITGGLSKKKK